jgi:hypothetical protein
MRRRQEIQSSEKAERARLEAEENLRLAAEREEWDMMGRKEDAAKAKEDEAKKQEKARLQMQQLEEVGYGDNFSTLQGAWQRRPFVSPLYRIRA